jgi:hypothetical protein
MASFSDSTSAYVVLVNNTIHSITSERSIADAISADTRGSVVQAFPIITSYQPQVAVTEAHDVPTFGEFLDSLPNKTTIPTIADIFKGKKTASKLTSISHDVKQDTNTAYVVADTLAVINHPTP